VRKTFSLCFMTYKERRNL